MRLFICSQQYKESDEAQRFLTFYPNNSGPGGGEWPYVLVLDPRTGEKLVTWSKFDAGSFPDLVASFLNLQPDFNNGSQKPPSPKRSRPSSPKDNNRDIIDADEDDQLAAAIKASLAESAPNNGGAPAANHTPPKVCLFLTPHIQKNVLRFAIMSFSGLGKISLI